MVELNLISRVLGSILVPKEERKRGAGAQWMTFTLFHIWDASMRTRVQIHGTQVSAVAHLQSQDLEDENRGPLPCSKLLS